MPSLRFLFLVCSGDSSTTWLLKVGALMCKFRIHYLCRIEFGSFNFEPQQVHISGSKALKVACTHGPLPIAQKSTERALCISSWAGKREFGFFDYLFLKFVNIYFYKVFYI
ncbi:hypothetical protein ACP275_10G114100 [Erythranthe tilingii]